MAGLAGKTIAIGGKGSATDFLTLLALTEAKIAAQTIPLGNPGVMPALRSGQVDAGIAWPLVSYQELVSGNFRPVFDFSTVEEKLVLNAWGASERMIADHEAVLARWLAANRQAILYMQSHEAWTLEFLKRYTGEEDDRVVKEAYDGSVMHLVADQKVKPQWLASSLALAAQSGIKNLPDVAAIYAKRFVPAASEN
jgi:ABC-type nitrate/sulfonate/bicarbonate transport system substrate-binding protein